MKIVKKAEAYKVRYEDDLFWNWYEFDTFTTKKKAEKAWKKAKRSEDYFIKKTLISIKKYKKLKKKGK